MEVEKQELLEARLNETLNRVQELESELSSKEIAYAEDVTKIKEEHAASCNEYQHVSLKCLLLLRDARSVAYRMCRVP